ncbi:helix-turn-helix domain-containing protein [Colwellia sp. E2M01]|nr:helix-turn-helix domain-containing protein [Colwellia sp. E2M01]
MNFQDVLNAVTAGDSDYLTAKKLGITRGTFSKYRCGNKTPSDETLDKMVELSGLPAEKVYLAAYAEKLHNPVVAEAFRHLAA